MAHQESDVRMQLGFSSVHEQLKILQISATIYCLRMGFWLVASADALWQGAKWILLNHKVMCHVKDRDTLVQ